MKDWEAPGYWRQLHHYLETLEQPATMDKVEFAKLQQKSATFFSSNGRLMRKHPPAPQIVISKDTYQEKLLQKVHEELGHQGIEETYQQLVTRFWWPGLKKKVKKWVQSCEACMK
jgi:hypothetical protein